MSTKKRTEASVPSIVRSSAAEYLTFLAASGSSGVEAVYADENVWLSQKMMGLLYGVETQTINYHLKKIFSDNELQPSSVIRDFRITAADGKTYNTQHHNLAATIAVGYKVNSERAVQFRKWAIQQFDVVVAKNYLSPNEMGQLQRLVSAYLDVAEDMAKRQIPMTMQDWETRLNRFIEAADREVLNDAGKVSAEIAQARALSEFEKYRLVQDRLFVSDFDAMVHEKRQAYEP